MDKKYNPHEFEQKWQDKWFADPFYEGVDLDNARKKYYLLLEFPYPSGPGMHMGHTRNDCIMDSVARLRRMLGYNVIFPMGWDAFGLPTENYAIKMKRKPQEITQENIKNFKRQLKSLGISFDWSREINTTDPQYYKWTQWIFLKLFEKGLAYKAVKPINWCPKCKIGCANEEVIDGKHERCGTPVVKKDVMQWVLRITEYADKLDKDLDLVDYPDSVKARQRNWIGKKTWYDIDYQVEGTDQILRVSTTRPDTQFGASFVVVAPEHEVLQKLLDCMPEENKQEVLSYIEKTKNKTDLERISQSKEKSGAFTGLFCSNSITGARLPIYAADFVLTTVGTGVVVGVPAHDKRDFDFAQKFSLPVIRVIEGIDHDRSEITNENEVYEEEGTVFNSQFLDGLSTKDACKKVGEIITEKGIGEVKTRYHLQDWIFSRQRYWGEPIPVVVCPNCGVVPLQEKDLPLELPNVDSYEPTDTGESPLANISEWVNVKCPNCGGDAKRETDTMPQWAGSSWYYLRYIDPKNSDRFADMDLMKYWLPVDHYEGGSEHVTLHLLYSRFWHKFLYDIGLVPTPEPYQKRTIHGMVLGEGGVKMSKSLGNVISPDDLVKEYGADVTRAYMMFIGPYEGDTSWSSETINGVKKFVSKYYAFILDKWENAGVSGTKEKQAIAHLINRVESNILDFKFNTSISALMEFYNEYSKSQFAREDVEKLILIVAPSLPHMAEELWMLTGHKYSVHMQVWPKVDTSLLVEDTAEIPVQINGKVRGHITVNVSDDQAKVESQIIGDINFAQYITSDNIKKFIYVPTKIVNIVTV